MSDNKKLQEYIWNMAYNEMPYGKRVWNSSAKNLSDELRMRGINLDKKIFYKYKLPENMSNQEFMDVVTISYFVRDFYSRHMLHVLRDASLTLQEKMDVLRYVKKKRQCVNKNFIDIYAREILDKNIELRGINFKSSEDFVNGAMFGFAPDEIRYFCDKSGFRDMNIEHKLQEELKKYGIEISYILAPETAKQLILKLQHNQLKKGNVKNSFVVDDTRQTMALRQQRM